MRYISIAAAGLLEEEEGAGMMMMMRLCGVAALIAAAEGHGLLTVPTPRDGTTQAGNNKGELTHSTQHTRGLA
jgi:hypothetical protein